MRLAIRIIDGAVLTGLAYGPDAHAQIAVSAIGPVPELVITSTGRCTLVSSQCSGVHGYINLDQKRGFR